MNQRAVLNLELVHKERIYILALPIGAPFDECLEAIAQFSDQIAEFKQKGKEAEEKAAREKEVAESEVAAS